MNASRLFARKILSVYWRIFKPAAFGVRALIPDKSGTRILLVKHSYIEGLYLPGGNLKKRETFAEGIQRELSEELNFHIQEMELFGIYANRYEHKNDNIVVFICKGFIPENKADREIEWYRHFEIADLPEHISPGTRKRINEYLSGKKGIVGK